MGKLHDFPLVQLRSETFNLTLTKCIRFHNFMLHSEAPKGSLLAWESPDERKPLKIKIHHWLATAKIWPATGSNVGLVGTSSACCKVTQQEFAQ